MTHDEENEKAVEADDDEEDVHVDVTDLVVHLHVGDGAREQEQVVGSEENEQFGVRFHEVQHEAVHWEEVHEVAECDHLQDDEAEDLAPDERHPDCDDTDE